MRMSSIAKHQRAGSGSALCRAIGDELRARRLSNGLTQSELGRPMTRAYVSAVEHGRAVPSLPALAILTDRLGTPMDEFFEGVHRRMTEVYNRGHEYHPDPPNPPSRRR